MSTVNVYCGGGAPACKPVEPCPNRAVRFVPILGPIKTTVGPVTRTPQYQRFPLFGELMMAVEMNTIQEFTVTIAPVNAKGQPAALDGVPEWLTSNSDALALEPAPDGLSCKVTAVGIPGSGSVQVTGDADLGTGVTPIVGTLDVNVSLAPATSIVMTAGPVTDQP